MTLIEQAAQEIIQFVNETSGMRVLNCQLIGVDEKRNLWIRDTEEEECPCSIQIKLDVRRQRGKIQSKKFYGRINYCDGTDWVDLDCMPYSPAAFIVAGLQTIDLAEDANSVII